MFLVQSLKFLTNSGVQSNLILQNGLQSFACSGVIALGKAGLKVALTSHPCAHPHIRFNSMAVASRNRICIEIHSRTGDMLVDMYKQPFKDEFGLFRVKFL